MVFYLALCHCDKPRNETQLREERVSFSSHLQVTVPPRNVRAGTEMETMGNSDSEGHAALTQHRTENIWVPTTVIQSLKHLEHAAPGKE